MRLRQLLADSRTVQLDGGLSTALEELGADVDDPLWTAKVLRDDPELVLAAHRAFVDAGAEIVISASYQAPDDLLAESVRVARRAGVLVAASVAPYGASLAGGEEYTGDYEVPAGWHERRLELLLEAEPDFVAIETQPRLDEAVAIAALLEDIDGWVTFTCRDGERTGHGERIEDAVAAVAAFGAVAPSASTAPRPSTSTSSCGAPAPSRTSRLSPTRTPAAPTTRRRRPGPAARRPGAATPRS